MVASWWRHGGVMVALVYALKPLPRDLVNRGFIVLRIDHSDLLPAAFHEILEVDLLVVTRFSNMYDLDLF